MKNFWYIRLKAQKTVLNNYFNFALIKKKPIVDLISILHQGLKIKQSKETKINENLQYKNE